MGYKGFLPSIILLEPQTSHQRCPCLIKKLFPKYFPTWCLPNLLFFLCFLPLLMKFLFPGMLLLIISKLYSSLKKKKKVSVSPTLQSPLLTPCQSEWEPSLFTILPVIIFGIKSKFLSMARVWLMSAIPTSSHIQSLFPCPTLTFYAQVKRTTDFTHHTYSQ